MRCGADVPLFPRDPFLPPGLDGLEWVCIEVSGNVFRNKVYRIPLYSLSSLLLPPALRRQPATVFARCCMVKYSSPFTRIENGEPDVSDTKI